MLLPHGDATVLCPIRGDEKFEVVPENHSRAIVIRGSRAGLIDPACIRAERFKPLPKFAVAKGDYDFFHEGAVLFPPVAVEHLPVHPFLSMQQGNRRLHITHQALHAVMAMIED